MRSRLILVALSGVAVIAVSPADARRAKASTCAAWKGRYQGTIRPEQSTVSAEPRRIQIWVKSTSTDISFGGATDPLIVIEHMRIRCSPTLLQGSFEDNWGATGRVTLRRNRSGASVSFSELAEGEGQNYVGYYPETDVLVKKVQ